MKHRTHASTAGLALLASGALIVGSAVTATATQGHSKPGICHPVEGNGETGYGWNLIRPDEASKHIDEATGAGKHTRKDGRTDVYADAAGHCPGFVVVTPTPTPTASETPTPEPTVSETPTPEPTQTTSPAPSPSVTVTEPTPTPSESTPTPTPSETTTAPEPSPTVTPTPTVTTPEPTVTPTTSSTTSPAPVTAKRAHVQPTGELAQTGAETWNLLAFGVMLLLLGAGLVAFATRNQGAHR